jgi:hypothetical protein
MLLMSVFACHLCEFDMLVASLGRAGTSPRCR